MPELAFVTAGVLAMAVAWWWYAHREEKVRGRGLAGLLRGIALFLILSAPWLPPFGGDTGGSSTTAILVDVSLSMRYPASAAGSVTRIQRAREAASDLLASRRASELWVFAGSATRLDPGDLEELQPGGTATRVVPAIEEVRAAGADSLILVTDGELSDREEGRRLARRLGIALREVRISETTARVGIRRLVTPGAVTAGDTLELRAEIVSTGETGSRTRVSLSYGGGQTVETTIATPASGRTAEAVFRVPVDPAGDSIEWRPFEVQVIGVEPPWDEAARARAWVRVSPQPTGAVMVSVDPDWEARYLLPLLQRSVPGGARAYLRIDDDLYLLAGPRPVPGVSEATVRRAARRAMLLVVQGEPGRLPGWLASAASVRPAVLHFVRGPGAVPGTDLTIRDALPGEWYVEAPPPASPVSAHLLGVETLDLPPLPRLFGSTGRSDWAVLSARQDRRGATRPVAVMGSTDNRRWAVVHGESTWRWAARGVRGLPLYRGLFSGIVGWLVERTVMQPVRLRDPWPGPGETLQWRLAPDVRDLRIEVEDSSGRVVWSDSLSGPAESIDGPTLAAGDARFVAEGRLGSSDFHVVRPFHVGGGDESLPGPFGPALDVPPARTEDGSARDPRGGTPVWPFAAAIVMLCAEWLWRRRVGLR